MDPTITRLVGDEVDRNPDLRRIVEALRVEPEDLLAYQAPVDGPRGPQSSKHRNGPAELCLYYEEDPPERRWTEKLGLLRLFDLARRHVMAEYIWRETGRWPTEGAPHGRAEQVPSDPSLALAPLRRPRRKAPCPCRSGLKAKRCCFK